VREAAIVADAPRTAAVPAPTVRATPVVVAAHLPPLPERPDTSRLLLAGWASPWPGRVTVLEETSGAVVARLERSATLGELLSPLAPGPVAIRDRGGALTLRLHAGHVAPVDDALLLAGANRLAVETDLGWEVLGFADADLLSPGIYRLSGLLRGLEGTDAAVAPAGTGRRVVVLDARVQTIDVPAAWLGESVALRALAGPADEVGVPIVAETGLGPLLPLAPVHLSAGRDGGGDIALRWVRRSRADTQSWTPGDVPLEHQPEAYRVTILDGPVPVRSFDIGLPAATYAAAAQLADFGAPPASFGWTVAQLSPLYGPGHSARASF